MQYLEVQWAEEVVWIVKVYDLEGILDKLTACIHQQHQQINELLKKLSQIHDVII